MNDNTVNNATDNSVDNNRLEARILSEVTVFVETCAAPAGDTSTNSIVISKTMDLSANGLQVVMDHPIPIGSILQVCVDFGLHQPRFTLIAEVRWVRQPAGQRQYLTGFQLLDSEGCNIEEWKTCVANLLSRADTHLDPS